MLPRHQNEVDEIRPAGKCSPRGSLRVSQVESIAYRVEVGHCKGRGNAERVVWHVVVVSEEACLARSCVDGALEYF